MTDIGYGGTAVNDRKFDNDHLMTVYSKAEAIAKALDENGFDTMWMAEHHFQPEGYECIPNRSEERRVGKECRSRWSPYH